MRMLFLVLESLRKTSIVSNNASFSLPGNKLTNVTELPGGNTAFGFKDGNVSAGDDYIYDANGNMIVDRNKGITGITYNHLNLPETVSISNTEGTGNITYIYNATGAKLKKIVTEGSSLIETEYTGNYVYKNGNLEFFNHPEGIVEKEEDGYKYVYQFKDHLGNVRLSYKDADKNGSITQDEIVQEKNYYPFGLTHKGYNDDTRGRNHSYGFGNKEEQEELGLGWIDITARNYDPALGRWMNIDPLADQMRRHSPYNYAFDNPIYFMDPDGMKPCPNGDCPDIIPEGEPYTPPVSNELDGGGITKEEFKYTDDNIKVSPVKDPTIISEQSPARVNPVSGVIKPHKGIDIVDVKASETSGKEIVNPSNGKIISVKSKDDGNGAGNRVHVRANTGDKYSFFHLQDGSTNGLKNGQEIKRGDKVGTIGTTGNSTGPHLHFEVRNKKGKVLNPRNAIPALKTAPATRIARKPIAVPISSDITGYK